jgi:hypothetical protein
MDEQIPDDDLDPQVQGEDYVLEGRMKASIADYYRAKHPHLRQPYDPWIRPTEGETS